MSTLEPVDEPLVDADDFGDTDSQVSPSKARRLASDAGTRLRRRLGTRRSVALLAVFFVIGAFYFWTGTSSGNPVHLGGAQTDFYNQLGDGFLHGHLYIPTAPPKSLTSLPNPYAPPCCDLTTYDTALYHGHLYLEYGATPVLVFYLPFRLLQLGDLPQNLAVILMSLAAFAAALCCLDFLVERFARESRLWKVVFAGVMLGLGLDLPFMLRSPSIYEASVAGGVCFLIWGIYWLATGTLRERPIPWRLALGSLGFGLAFGAHADLALAAVVLAVAAGYLWRRSRGTTPRDRRRIAAAVLGPFIVIAIVLAAYNHARFGSFTETGEKYDVGCNCVHAKVFRPEALVEGGYQYFLVPPRFTLAFPYFNLPPLPEYFWSPLSNNLVEPVGGILAIAPLTLDLLALPLLLRKRRTRPVAAPAAVLVVAGLLVAFAVSSVGTVNVRYTQRLEADFAFLLIFPAIAVWLAIGGRRWYQRLATVVGAAFILFGSLVGTTISMTGYYNDLYASAPTTFRNLSEATSAFPTFITWLIGKPYITGVASPAGPTSYVYDFTTIGVGNSLSFYLSPAASEIDVIAPSTGTYNFELTMAKGPDAPTSTSGKVTIAMAYGGYTVGRRYIDGPQKIRVHLRRGINRIDIAANATGTPAPAEGSREVLVTGLNFVRAQ